MGGSPKSNTTQTNKLDPFVREQTEKNIGIADEIASKPYQAYTGAGVVGFNDTQQNAQQGLIDLANSGAGQAGWQQAGDIASQVAGATPQQVQAQSGASGIQDYMSSYTDRVVDSTLDSIDRSRRMAVNQGQDASISAGAFDGSRSALADAATNEAYARQSADAAAGLYNQGYQVAAQNAQQDASRALQAGQANQQAQLRANGQSLAGAQLLGQAGQSMYQNGINDQNLIAGVGDAQQQQAQQQADYARAEWEREQGYDERMLRLRQEALGQSPLINAGSTTQSGGQRSKMAGALGGAATGASVGSFGGPMGTAIGAGIGGTAGLLGWI